MGKLRDLLIYAVAVVTIAVSVGTALVDVHATTASNAAEANKLADYICDARRAQSKINDDWTNHLQSEDVKELKTRDGFHSFYVWLAARNATFNTRQKNLSKVPLPECSGVK